ncbi:MAG: outer membrane protein [Terracidiphilus sp.]
MRRQLKSMILAAAIAGAFAVPRLAAQSAPVQAASARARFQLSVAVTYDETLANSITSESFWMEGGRVQVCGDFYRGLGAVADIAGMNAGNIRSTGISLDMVTATFGPRYTWSRAHSRTSYYGQALLGEAEGFNGLFPEAGAAVSSTYSMALQVGGGVSVALSPRVSLRAFQADWLRTQFPNSTTLVQNNLHLGAGIVFRFR